MEKTHDEQFLALIVSVKPTDKERANSWRNTNLNVLRLKIENCTDHFISSFPGRVCRFVPFYLQLKLNITRMISDCIIIPNSTDF